MRYGSQQDFSQIPVKGFRPEASSSPPVNPVVGQEWTDTSVTPAKVRWFDGTSWIAADGTSIPVGYITNALINASAGIVLSKLAVDPLARANHTGTQTAATISDFNTAVRTNRLDQLAVPTVNVDFNGVRAVNLATPVGATDAVNKSYVDNARAGLSVKDPVQVALQVDVPLTAPGATIDGVTMSLGDRFLATTQTTSTENGIYVFNGPATPATRSDDADEAGEVVDGSMVAVADGTYAGYQYIQTTTSSATPGSWVQTWVVFTMGGQTYTAGTGLTQSGTVISLGAPVPVNLGGTGATTALDARTNLGATTKFAVDLGALTSGATYVLSHGLGTPDVGVWFRTTGDGRVFDLDWAVADDNTVNVLPDLSYTAGAIRAVVLG
jgi:hypothetical protein